MSLEKKIRDWEDESPKLFSKLKDSLGETIFRFNHRKNRCYDRESFSFKYQKCNKCNYLYNHLSYREGHDRIGIPCGKRKGKYLSIVKENGEDIYVMRPEIMEINIEIGKKIHKFYRDEFFCITNINWYSTSSQLLNLSLMMMVLRLYAIRKNFPFYIDYLTFYNCTETNFLFYIEKEYEGIESFNKDPNYGSSYSPLAQQRCSNNFSVDVTRDIIFECVLTLRFYTNLFFTHNDLDYSKLRFSGNTVHLQYDDEEFISSFKCFIFPSTYSSISVYDSEKNWWGRFFYTKEQKKVDQKESIPFEDFIIEMNGTKNYYKGDPFEMGKFFEKENTYLEHRVYFYKINKKMEYFLKMRRERGSTWGLHSFDIITLFSSLMTVPYFSETVVNSDELFRLWLGLWRKDEGHIITDILTSQKKPLLFRDICRIIKKFYIRFDALIYLYRELSR